MAALVAAGMCMQPLVPCLAGTGLLCYVSWHQLKKLVSPSDSSNNSDKKEKKVKKERDGNEEPRQNPKTGFQPRSDEEVKQTVERWLEHVHPRALDFFSTEQQLREVLESVARGTDANSDIILNEGCAFWYGDVTNDDLQASIRMIKPGETTESVTYLNRVLAFIFADDRSFKALMKLPKVPFKMSSLVLLHWEGRHASL